MNPSDTGITFDMVDVIIRADGMAVMTYAGPSYCAVWGEHLIGTDDDAA